MLARAEGNGSRTVTREDVARRAGVSTATVSYVVNDGPRPVSAAARKAVLEAIEALGYRPDRIARTLARRRSQAIAFISPDITNPILADLARAIDEAATDSGYTLVVLNANHSVERQRAQIAFLDAMRVDGVLVVTPGDDPHRVLSILEHRCPIVLVEREIPDAPVDMVLVDNVDIGRQATDHLLEHGHIVVGCVGGPGAAKRIRGYQESLVLGGLAVRPELIRTGEPDLAGGASATEALLSADPRPTAIFATNDRMAAGAISAVRGLGLRVPEDLAIVGADDSYVTLVTVPPLTTVALPVPEMARLATTLLMERIRATAPPAPRQVAFKARLTVRASCGCTSREMAPQSTDGPRR
jgi:LacI family transcriptional regulator, galactose operon repressor